MELNEHKNTSHNSAKAGQVFIYKCFDEKKVKLGNDQEKAQSERNSHSKNRGGKTQ